MAESLNTSTANGGTQSTTESPQGSVGGGGLSAGSQSSGQVQPGTATDVLSNKNGVPLSGTALTTVDLSNTTSGAATPVATSQTKHHINAPLFGITAVLFLVAIALFWLASRTAKNTTEY